MQRITTLALLKWGQLQSIEILKVFSVTLEKMIVLYNSLGAAALGVSNAVKKRGKDFSIAGVEFDTDPDEGTAFIKWCYFE